jgi:hypothetical protein
LCRSINGSHSGIFSLITSALRNSMIFRTLCNADKNSGLCHTSIYALASSQPLCHAPIYASLGWHVCDGSHAIPALPAIFPPSPSYRFPPDDSSSVRIQEDDVL